MLRLVLGHARAVSDCVTGWGDVRCNKYRTVKYVLNSGHHELVIRVFGYIKYIFVDKVYHHTHGLPTAAESRCALALATAALWNVRTT